MFRFESPEIFYYLLIIPAAVILFAIARRLRRRALERFGETGLVSRLMPEYSASRRYSNLFCGCWPLHCWCLVQPIPRLALNWLKPAKAGST